MNACLLAFFLALPLAHAEAQTPAVPDTPAPPDASTVSDTSTAADSLETDLQGKDPGRAVLWSLGGTVLLAPVFGAGVIFGPAFGHFYAENEAQAWRGIGIRVGAVLVPVVATTIAVGGENEGYEGLGVFVLSSAIAGIGIVISAIYDIADADNSARAYNRAHGLSASGAEVQAAPTVGGPQGEQIGLTLQVQF